MKKNALKSNENLRQLTLDSASKVLSIFSNAVVDSPNLSLNFTANLVEPRAFVNSGPEEVFVCAKYVSESAYYSCKNLKSVIITKTVEYLGTHFIDNCPNFISLSFLDLDALEPQLVFAPQMMWKIDTFDLASSFPDRTTTIGSRAFAGCTKITGSLEMPKLLKTIGQNAFHGCTGINGFIEFSKCTQLESIGNCAFLLCSGISGTLNLPNSLNYIGEYAFTDCNFVGPLTIPNKVTKISKHAFSMCRTFSGSIVIGNSVETIGDFAFSECKGLNGQLEIHSNVLTSIGNSAFYGCTNLKGMLVLPNSLLSIGALAFYNCFSFTNTLTLPESLLTIGESAFAFCQGFTGILSIPPSVIFIGANAFFNCQGLDKINFPKEFGKNLNSTLDIQDKAFGNLMIDCLSNVPSICSISNKTNKEGFPDEGNSRCYDSANFDWLANIGTIGENCEMKETFEIIIGVVSAIAVTGTFGIIGKITLHWFKHIYTHRRRIQYIFNEIMKKTKREFEINENETECTRNAITRIQRVLIQEKDNPDFTFSQMQLQSMIESAIKSHWKTIRYTIQSDILNNCFNDINFEDLESHRKVMKNNEKSKCCTFCSKQKKECILSETSESLLTDSLV